MAARKMIAPHLPPKALAKLQADYDTAEIRPDVRVLDDGVLLWFTKQTQFVLMRSRGARQLAALLLAKADELDRAAKD
jgi:hypothetical protein